ncbi:MAG: FxsA family protein [SAR324 cluster bacterium]|nr:FxsA family protein [SAR324 cluster bacterium]
MQLTFFMPLSTIFLQCIVTLAAGVWLIQDENFSLLTLVQSELRNRRVPAEEVFADLLLWCGGVLLIVPGLLTDALGLVIFIPVVRQESIFWLRNRIQEYLGLPPLN